MMNKKNQKEQIDTSKILLWLDDFRNPYTGNYLYRYAPDYISKKDLVVWVKSFDEFSTWILTNGLPKRVCFDHDLADEHYAPYDRWDDYYEWAKEQDFKEKTGHECAKWLIDYCLDHDETLPEFLSQSSNPAGADNIVKTLISFQKFQQNDNK